MRPYKEVELSGRDLPQHGGDDEPVKWPDDRQIGSAKQIVGQYPRGRSNALGLAGACDIDHEAKIKVLVVEARNKAIQVAAKSSFGFGDVNSCVVFRKWAG